MIDFQTDRQCIYISYKRCKVLNKVCERGTTRHQKVYERGTIFVKNGIYKGIPKGLDLYKHLLSTPSPLNEFSGLQGVKCLHIGLKRETCHDDIRMRRGLINYHAF